VSEFPHPIPWKKYGAVAASLIVLNLAAYFVFAGRQTDAWLSVLTFTLIYVVIWFCIKVFDTEKAYRQRHAVEAAHYFLTTMLEVVLLIVAIYVYFLFSLGGSEPLHALAGFLREKFATSATMGVALGGLLIFFVIYLAYEFFHPDGDEGGV